MSCYVRMIPNNLQDVAPHILWVRCHKADAPYALHLRNCGKELGKGAVRFQIPSVGIDILSQQHHLHDAVSSKTLAFPKDVSWLTASLMAPHIGDNAVCAVIVTSEHDVDAGLVGIFALNRKVFDDFIRRIPKARDLMPLRVKGTIPGFVYLTQVLREAEKIVRAEDQVYVRIALFDPGNSALLLRHAAADGNLHVGIVFFIMGCSSKTPEEMLIRIVADRAGVVNDKIRRFLIDFLVAGGTKNAG